jgi:hypothetical protein
LTEWIHADKTTELDSSRKFRLPTDFFFSKSSCLRRQLGVLANPPKAKIQAGNNSLSRIGGRAGHCDCNHCGVCPASLLFPSCEPNVPATILARQILRCQNGATSGPPTNLNRKGEFPLKATIPELTVAVKVAVCPTLDGFGPEVSAWATMNETAKLTGFGSGVRAVSRLRHFRSCQRRGFVRAAAPLSRTAAHRDRR